MVIYSISGRGVFLPLGNQCMVQKVVQTIQLMKVQGQQQFSAEKNIIKKALKTLVASKHEIRIHFLNNTTLQVHRKDPQYHASTNNAPADHQDQQMQPSNPESQPLPNQLITLSNKKDHSIKPKEDLFEVVYRNANRMQSIGWHQELQTRRTSNMSRTFRRRRKSNIQDYTTLQHHIQPQDNDSRSKVMKSSRLAINNLQLNGLTNKETLQKSTKSNEFANPLRPNTVKAKHVHILALIGQRNRLKEAQIIPTVQPAKGVFSLAVGKLNKKWKFQVKPEGSQSAREMNTNNPYMKQLEQSDFSQPVSSQCRREKAQKEKGLQQHHVDNIFFLKQLKPSPIIPIQRQKSQSKRAYSQFIRSRPKPFQKFSPQKMQAALEQGCRPWSVLRNLDDKIDEGKPSLDEPING